MCALPEGCSRYKRNAPTAGGAKQWVFVAPNGTKFLKKKDLLRHVNVLHAMNATNPSDAADLRAQISAFREERDRNTTELSEREGALRQRNASLLERQTMLLAQMRDADARIKDAIAREARNAEERKRLDTQHCIVRAREAVLYTREQRLGSPHVPDALCGGACLRLRTPNQWR